MELPTILVIFHLVNGMKTPRNKEGYIIFADLVYIASE